MKPSVATLGSYARATQQPLGEPRLASEEWACSATAAYKMSPRDILHCCNIAALHSCSTPLHRLGMQRTWPGRFCP